MVKTSLYIPTRGKADGDIGRELSITAPEVMCRVHKLLHGRPEVVSKLSSLNYNTNFVTEAAHPIGCPDDVVLSNRRIENTLIPKLLEHPLRDIEDASLILVGDILPPEEGVRIMTKLLLERLV